MASTYHDTKSTQQTQMADLTLKDLEAQPSIRVEPGHGYHLQLFGKSEFSPEDVYRVLIDPRIGTWRSIVSCPHRCVEEESDGKRRIRVSHRAVAKFLFLTVHFDTHLLVWEDDAARTIRFQHANSNGFMAKFEGSWHVHPFTQTALTQALATHSSTAASRGAPGVAAPPASEAGAAGQAGWGGGGGLPQWRPPSWLSASALMEAVQSHLQPSPPPLAPQQSLVTLEQHIVPKAPTPPGIKHLVQGLCAQQLRDMMTDLEAELCQPRQRQQPALSTCSACTTEAARPLPEQLPA
ncbi:hypothetical protein V8C86DRAFT_697996 [Haematococcus lacustris]